MVVVSCPTRVKYNNTCYRAYESFIIQDDEVASFEKLGATIIAHKENPEVVKAKKAEVAEATEELLKMNVAKLKAYAKENNIDISDVSKKADIYNKIVLAIK